MYKWARVSDNNYEVSTKGDKRFSALYAKLKDSRTIEEAYQLDIKGYREFSNDWKFGKGKKPLRDITEEQLFKEYKNLWITFFNENPELLKELSISTKDKTITDLFAYTNISQARAIAEILNETTGENKMNTDKDLKKAIVELSRLSISRPNAAGRTSTLMWSYRNEYPRLLVYINGSDKSVTGRNNMIIAPFSFLALNTLTEILTVLPTMPNDTEFEIDCLNAKWVDNKKTDDTRIQASIKVGKDEHGMIYISLSEENKPIVKFNLTLQVEWNPVRLNGVNVESTELGSKLFVSGYVKQINKCYNDILSAISTIKIEEPYAL